MPWLTKNLLRENSSTRKRRIFRRFLVVEVAGRLTPFNAETPKSDEKTRFRAGSDYSIHLSFVVSLILPSGILCVRIALLVHIAPLLRILGIGVII